VVTVAVVVTTAVLVTFAVVVTTAGCYYSVVIHFCVVVVLIQQFDKLFEYKQKIKNLLNTIETEEVRLGPGTLQGQGRGIQYCQKRTASNTVCPCLAIQLYGIRVLHAVCHTAVCHTAVWHQSPARLTTTGLEYQRLPG